MLEVNLGDYQTGNLLSNKEIIKVIGRLRKKNKKIGLCLGCFDLLHPGHIAYFNYAKRFCDVLIVGVAKDHYIINTKPGTKRPIFSHNLRAFMVGNLKSVDYVILDDCITQPNDPLDIVEFIKPDIFVRGPDYADKKDLVSVYREQLIKSWEGKTIYYPKTSDEKISVTGIIKYIKEAT